MNAESNKLNASMELMADIFTVLEKEFPGLDPIKWGDAVIARFHLEHNSWIEANPAGTEADWHQWCLDKRSNPFRSAALEVWQK